MSLVVLLILAIVWAVFLIPQVMRARGERPADSIGAFRKQLSVLERTSPLVHAGPSPFRAAAEPLRGHQPGRQQYRPAASTPRAATAPTAFQRHTATVQGLVPLGLPANRVEARKRRRDVFNVLVACMGATFVLGLVPGLRFLLLVHVLLDVAFVAFVTMLVRARNVALERELKVRFLPEAPAAPEPALLLRRSAN